MGDHIWESVLGISLIKPVFRNIRCQRFYEKNILRGDGIILNQLYIDVYERIRIRICIAEQTINTKKYLPLFVVKLSNVVKIFINKDF